MPKRSQNQSKDMINFHRLANIGQLLIKMNEQLDIIQAISLSSEEEKEAMRKELREFNNGKLEESRKQDNEAGGDDSGSMENLGDSAE